MGSCFPNKRQPPAIPTLSNFQDRITKMLLLAAISSGGGRATCVQCGEQRIRTSSELTLVTLSRRTQAPILIYSPWCSRQRLSSFLVMSQRLFGFEPQLPAFSQIYYISCGECEVRTHAALSSPTCLANRPLHHLGNSPYSKNYFVGLVGLEPTQSTSD